MMPLAEPNKGTVQVKSKKNYRLSYLDGMRGLAVFLVILFHVFSDRWVDFLPYRDVYHDYFKFGYMGVQIFFVISGFVISMTLEKCGGFGEFMYRRWLRLFPAMLIVSLLILATSALLTNRPYGTPQINDLIPGLTFIEPEFYRTIFNNNQKVLEGAFWTLFVEAKFYLVAGLLYFAFGQKKMIVILIGMFLTFTLFSAVSNKLPVALAGNLDSILHYLNYRHYGWFAAGALFYRYHSHRSISALIWGIVIALMSARSLDGFLTSSMVFATLLIMLFVGAMLNERLQKLLSNNVLVFLGFISYPLYLVHENAVVSMVIQMHHQYPSMPPYLLPVLPVAILILIAWIVAQYLEPALRSLIKNIVKQSRLVVYKQP